jgi:hypothetical protein
LKNKISEYTKLNFFIISMENIVQRDIILNELIQINSYIFMINYDSNSIELEQIINFKLNYEEDDMNFKEIYEKIQLLIINTKKNMRELTSIDFYKWSRLDSILYGLEKSIQLIELSIFNPINYGIELSTINIGNLHI